jgi:RimJ/RimL family protein N-acetyltransferase
MTRLIALIEPENHGSKRVAGKLGMSRERDVAHRGKRVERFSSSG